MWWALTTHELMAHAKSLTFLVGLVVALVLSAVSTTINTRDFVRRQRDCTADMQTGAYNSLEYVVHRTPHVMSCLVQGKDRRLGNRIGLSVYEVPEQTSGYLPIGSEHNHYITGFTAVDVVFVVKFVLSLVAVFLSYDSVCGEKRQGTLRLVYANSVPRHSLLVAKATAGMCVLLVALVATVAAALSIPVLSPHVQLGYQHAIQVVWLCLASFLYLGTVYCAGLVVSVLVNRPSTSLLLLVQAWLFTTVVYPNAAVSAAETGKPTLSQRQLEDSEAAAAAQELKEYDDARALFLSQVRDPNTRLSREVQLRYYTATVRKTEALLSVRQHQDRARADQAHLARTLLMLSPASLFELAAVEIAGTGIRPYDRFMGAVLLFWRSVAEHHIQDAKLRWTGEGLPKPTFSVPSSAKASQVPEVRPHLTALSLLNVALFLLAYRAFIRKDVR